MRTDFELFIEEVKKTTGVDVVIYSERGTKLAGNGELEPIPAGLDNVYTDTASERTYFSINCKGKKCVGRILGSSENERVIAQLLKALAENHFSKDNEKTEQEFFRALIMGEISDAQFKRFSYKFSLPMAQCFVMLVTCDEKYQSDVGGVLKNYCGKHDEIVFIDGKSCALIKFVDALCKEYQSSTELASYLARSVYDELGVEIKIAVGGTVGGARELAYSYQQAVTTARIARQTGSKESVHSYKEYCFFQMLEDLPKYKLNEYLSVVMGADSSEIFEDSEMVDTAETFLDNNLNVSETARVLFLHRNTLTYRLDKIEQVTGLNLRKFSDAVTFRLITSLKSLLK